MQVFLVILLTKTSKWLLDLREICAGLTSDSVPPSDDNVDCYAIIKKLLESIFNIIWNQNCYLRDLVEHTRLSLHKVA